MTVWSRDMCRFLVYTGSKNIILSKLITDPSHSILTQSHSSKLRLETSRGSANADGFGIGWYVAEELGPEPCIFTSTLPAWNCVNLARLAPKISSRLIFAHVRATTEGALAEQNCHPFQHNTLMWMHNGNIGGWQYVKRPLADSLSDKWYHSVKGGTDSEWAFGLFLSILEEEGVDPSSEPKRGFGRKTLREAMKKTIAQINAFVKAIPCEHKLGEVETRSLLNFAVTDGHTVMVTRYVSSRTDEAASLYYSSGTDWVEDKSGKTRGHFKMERRDKASDVVLVASEPLTFERHNWLPVQSNTIVSIANQTVFVDPIKDEYFTPDYSIERSSEFALTKGLISKAPGGGPTTPSCDTMTPVGTPEPEDRLSINGEELGKKFAKLNGT